MNEICQLREELRALNEQLYALRKGEGSATPAEQSALSRRKREVAERIGKLEKHARRGR